MIQKSKTIEDFKTATKIEWKAAREKFLSIARSSMFDKIRLGDIAGPLESNKHEHDSNNNTVTILGKIRYNFNWGKLQEGKDSNAFEENDIPKIDNHIGALTEDTKYFKFTQKLDINKTFWFQRSFFDWKFLYINLFKIMGSGEWPQSSPPLKLCKTSPAEQRAFDACLKIADDANYSVLTIKGPPGTGKTDLLAKVAIALAEKGKRVGIVSMSHAAVDNALARIQGLAAGASIAKHSSDPKTIPGKVNEINLLKLKKEVTPPQIWGAVIQAALCFYKQYKNREKYYYCDPLKPKFGRCDVLLVDEAGQVPAHDGCALSGLAEKMIFFGDEDQLPNIASGVHKPGSHGDSSAMLYLSKVLDESLVIPLETTHRMNDEICNLIQKKFYPKIDRLKSDTNVKARLYLKNTQQPSLFRYQFSPERRKLSCNREEAKKVAELVEYLLTMQVKDIDGIPQVKDITPADIAILTPFRAHVEFIQEELGNKLPTFKKDQLPRVGTVDKMQGQGAAVVIYSLATSSSEYIADLAEWLFSPNRWNVAISRAKACVIVVGDLEAHWKSEPKTLPGIDAKEKISELFKDENGWKDWPQNNGNANP
jgi:hypothetical protein